MSIRPRRKHATITGWRVVPLLPVLALFWLMIFLAMLAALLEHGICHLFGWPSRWTFTWKNHCLHADSGDPK